MEEGIKKIDTHGSCDGNEHCGYAYCKECMPKLYSEPDACEICGTEKVHIPDLGQTWKACPECKKELFKDGYCDE